MAKIKKSVHSLFHYFRIHALFILPIPIAKRPMLSKTCGIALHRIIYSESSLIAKIYTEQYGLCSFLVHEARKKNTSSKANLLQPFSLVELVAYHKETSGLQKIKEIKNNFSLKTVQSDPSKIAIAFFLSEILSKSLREGIPDKPLFTFLSESIIFLDRLANPSCFHLLFLIKLTKFLGFYPQAETSGLAKSTPFFDLLNGSFTREQPAHSRFLNPELSAHLQDFIAMNFADVERYVMEKKYKTALLEKIIDFYRLHLTILPEIKSLRVLEAIMKG